MAAVEVPRGPVGQPDIGYAPNHDKYLARVKRRLETEKLDKSLPPGFPKKLESDLVWEGDTIADKYNWVYELSNEELEEIDNALAHFKSLNVPLGLLNQDTFPLPNLHATLRDISREIHNGRGFRVIRGLAVNKYDREENIIIYAGLSDHIAPIRGRQDHLFQGKPADVILNHIKDMRATKEGKHIGTPAYTTEKQVFHTDSGDVVALYCLSEGASGGQSKLSSSWRVYNELVESRPDLIRTLADPWVAEEFGNPSRPYSVRPLLNLLPADDKNSERLIIQYARRTFVGYQALPRSSSLPPITEAQAEALDTLHFLADKFSIGLDFRQGDIQYINNLSIFHARDEFTDTPEKQRHLIRLWLRDPEYAWPTPPVLQWRWDRVYKGVTPENSVFPIEPRIRSEGDGRTRS